MANIENCPTCDTQLEIEDSYYDQIFECPNCKAEIMIPKPRKGPRIVRTAPLRVTVPTKPEGVGQESIIAGYAIAIIVPFIGFFVGIYLLAKKEPGHGVACMAISILAAWFWCAMLFSS
jgi:hypothetical protein